MTGAEPKTRRLVAAWVVGLAALIACSDYESPSDPAFGLPDVAVAEPTLERDVQPIFTRRCSIGGCHSLVSRRAGLVLTPDSSYAMLVERVAFGLPGDVMLEASWLPPVQVFGVKANLVNAALSAPLGRVGGVALRGRVGMPWGKVTGAITCSSDVAEDGGPTLQFYYLAICNGNESEDEFQPRHVSAELLATNLRPRPILGGSWSPWGALGIRREWSRFDIGVMDDEGDRDLDHPIIEVRGTRPHGSIGLAWVGPRGASLAGEFLYAPGSLATARLYAGIRR